MKKSIIIYADYISIVEELTIEQSGRLFLAILSYINDEMADEMADDPAVKMAFRIVRNQIDRDAEKYERICKKRSEAGKKHRGNQYTRLLDKLEQMEQMEQKFQNGTNGTNGTDNDNDNDNDNDILLNENDNKEESRKKKPAAARFVKPTIEEVQDYCNEKGYEINVPYFYNYWESKGWKRGTTSVKDWKALIRSWYYRDHSTAPSPKQSTQDDGYQRVKKTTSTT
jgi:hypothetical protein